MPWLTVIVPTYNRAKYLEVCLTSLKEQSCPDWECVIVDDGSTDHSALLANRFVAADSRFRYQYQGNAGVSAARNAGLSRACGEWVSFLDSDDFYFRRAVEKFKLATNLSRQRGVDPGIVSGQLVISGREPLPPTSTAALTMRDRFFRVMNFSKNGRSLLLQNTIFHQATLESMEGGFSTSLPTSEDREFLIRAAAAREVLMLETLVACYRTDHGEGKSDQFHVRGGKLKAHRQIYATLDQASVIRRRLARQGEQGHFERLRLAHLTMLDAAELMTAGDAGTAADRLQIAESLCHNDEERVALIRAFAFFFLFPASQPRGAVRRSLQALRSIGAHLERGSSVLRTLEQRPAAI